MSGSPFLNMLASRDASAWIQYPHRENLSGLDKTLYSLSQHAASHRHGKRRGPGVS